MEYALNSLVKTCYSYSLTTFNINVHRTLLLAALKINSLENLVFDTQAHLTSEFNAVPFLIWCNRHSLLVLYRTDFGSQMK